MVEAASQCREAVGVFLIQRCAWHSRAAISWFVQAAQIAPGLHGWEARVSAAQHAHQAQAAPLAERTTLHAHPLQLFERGIAARGRAHDETPRSNSTVSQSHLSSALAHRLS